MTNVAIVRYRKNGKRFEVAAYKNKVRRKDFGAMAFTGFSLALLLSLTATLHLCFPRLIPMLSLHCRC